MHLYTLFRVNKVCLEVTIHRLKTVAYGFASFVIAFAELSQGTIL
jgi:hypothetical protein